MLDCFLVMSRDLMEKIFFLAAKEDNFKSTIGLGDNTLVILDE